MWRGKQKCCKVRRERERETPPGRPSCVIAGSHQVMVYNPLRTEILSAPFAHPANPSPPPHRAQYCVWLRGPRCSGYSALLTGLLSYPESFCRRPARHCPPPGDEMGGAPQLLHWPQMKLLVVRVDWGQTKLPEISAALMRSCKH